MSQSTISRAARDPDLQQRVEASVYDQAFNNVDLGDTIFGAQVRNGYVNLQPMYWAVAVSVQAAYEAGVLNGRGSPGHDEDVISDAMILSAVQAEWPADPDVVTPA